MLRVMFKINTADGIDLKKKSHRGIACKERRMLINAIN